MRAFIPFIIMFACLVMFGLAMVGLGLSLLDPWLGGATMMAALLIGWGAATDLDQTERLM